MFYAELLFDKMYYLYFFRLKYMTIAKHFSELSAAVYELKWIQDLWGGGQKWELNAVVSKGEGYL